MVGRQSTSRSGCYSRRPEGHARCASRTARCRHGGGRGKFGRRTTVLSRQNSLLGLLPGTSGATRSPVNLACQSRLWPVCVVLSMTPTLRSCSRGMCTAGRWSVRILRQRIGSTRKNIPSAGYQSVMAKDERKTEFNKMIERVSHEN